jgi:hypothetical protein
LPFLSGTAKAFWRVGYRFVHKTAYPDIPHHIKFLLYWPYYVLHSLVGTPAGLAFTADLNIILGQVTRWLQRAGKYHKTSNSVFIMFHTSRGPLKQTGMEGRLGSYVGMPEEFFQCCDTALTLVNERTTYYTPMPADFALLKWLRQSASEFPSQGCARSRLLSLCSYSAKLR